MIITLLGERFDSTQVEETFENDVIGATNRAIEMSNEHDMDWVLMLADKSMVGHYVDGEQQ